MVLINRYEHFHFLCIDMVTLIPELCVAGTVSADGFVPCTPCGIDEYQAAVGETACASCPPGTGTVATGSTTSDACLGKIPYYISSCHSC